MKNISTFAVFNAKNSIKHIVVTAIFMAVTLSAFLRCNKRGYQIHAGCDTCVITVLGGTGGDSLSYFQLLNFSFAMPRTMKTTSKVNNSSHTCAPTERNTVSVSDRIDQLQSKFNIEKNAKNEAYHFILSRGLLKDFAEFSRLHQDENNHQSCINHLAKQGV